MQPRLLKSAITALVATTVLLTACAPPGGAGNTPSADGPIRVGFLASLTGVAAGPANDMRNGFELFWRQDNHKVANRDIQVFVGDDEGKPNVGLSVASRLVERDQVNVMVGPHLASVGSAVGEYVRTKNIPMIYPIPASGEFLKKPIDTMLLAGGTAAQFTHPLGKWAAQQGKRRALTISSDYTFGQEIAGGFANTFTDYGGQVVKQLWTPLGTTDYGPFASEIAAGNYDVVFNGLQANDAVVFQKAWDNFGLSKKGPLLVGAPSTIDQSLIRSMGAAAEGTVSIGHFAEGRTNGETARFVSAYEQEFHQLPGYYAASGYFGAQLAAAALEKLGGKIPDAKTFIRTAGSISLPDSVFGPVSMDQQGNIRLDGYLRKVAKRPDGSYWNVVTDVIPAVSPSYEYKYDAFLAQPTYTRNYQGVDWPTSCAAYVVNCPLGR
jgi:branched-chain amino acid transport system substrate-binding protein